MSKRFFQILLLSLLLCSQLAVALHDLDHQSLDHTEICKIYYSADAPLNVTDTSHRFDSAPVSQLSSILENVDAAPALLLSHAPRAPPLNS